MMIMMTNHTCFTAYDTVIHLSGCVCVLIISVYVCVSLCASVRVCVCVLLAVGPQAGPPTVSWGIVGSWERVWILALFVCVCWHHCADGTKSPILLHAALSIQNTNTHTHTHTHTHTYIYTHWHTHTPTHMVQVMPTWPKKKLFLFLTHVQTSMYVYLDALQHWHLHFSTSTTRSSIYR